MLKISSHSALLPARAASRSQELKRGEEGCFIVGRRERGKRAPLRSRRADYGRPRDAKGGLDGPRPAGGAPPKRNEIHKSSGLERDAVFGTATGFSIIREKVQNSKLQVWII